ncbi:MAG: heliorhodopsin HeR [Nitriliruptoraceae bacterium]|nr:heliorhodopsin HeR [Nitriliruptoraceae bacterium]
MTTSTTTTPPREVRYARLRRFNVVVGLLHLGQAVVLLALANDLALPVFATFLEDDPVEQQGIGTPELIFELPIAVLVAIFVLFAAADHLLVAAPRIKDWYERKLDARANYARWIEYSVSSSIMIVLIAAFVGIWDLAAVVAIFAVNTTMILFGLLWERTVTPGPGADWSAFWFGTFAGAVPWAILGYYLFAPDADIPGFVYAIYGFQLVLFWSFAANMALQYAQVGRWRDYIFGEYAYIVLSLAAKTLLAWLIFGNVLRS